MQNYREEIFTKQTQMITNTLSLKTHCETKEQLQSILVQLLVVTSIQTCMKNYFRFFFRDINPILFTFTIN